jgi:hypothetical protein
MQDFGVKKRLIELGSSSQLDSLRFGLERYAKITKRPMFYIHSPRDLVCSAPFIQRDPTNVQQGALQKGPGGALYDFLQANKSGVLPVLVVNYEQFETEDLVRFNSLLDEQRCADGTTVPEEALVIGLTNTNKPDYYQGSDFYGRFDKTEICPVLPHVLEKELPTLKFIQQSIEKSIKNSPINLFNDNNWKDLLLGRWTLVGKKLVFQEGALVPALKLKGQDDVLHLEIQNGLWNDQEFQNFWRQAFQRGFIEHAGRRIEISANLQLMQSTGYDWKALKTFFQVKKHLSSEQTEVLNPQRFNQFLKHDAYSQESKTITNTQGFIEKAKGNFLKVILTHQLHEDQWARLLSECQLHKVNLQIECAPGVVLPKELLSTSSSIPPIITTWKSKNVLTATQVMTSSDVDSTIAMLTAQHHHKWQIIDVSECTAADLLERIDSSFNRESLSFSFQHQFCALNQALTAQTPLILKGRFSSELEQALAPLLLKRQKQAGSANLSPLVLVSDNPKSFQYIPTQTHEVSVAEKETCLKLQRGSALEKKLQPFLCKEPLSILKVRREFWQAYPNSLNSKEPWRGLLESPGAVPPLTDLNSKTSAQEAKAFHQNRLKAINNAFKNAPYVFLTGLSGVGKSTFVTQYLSQSPYSLTLLDQDSTKQQINATIKKWALDKSTTGDKLLFIDEATLSPSDWSVFEGLFHEPRGILVNGIWLPLSAKHKVIFAGNPVSYGDERKLATFFQRHGNTVVFEPLPVAVLYEDVLKPA